ncbi:MAG: T9SS type A sorting domain-containing protein [Ignavibacteriaceae bacterium]
MQKHKAGEFRLYQNFPNPFNPNTNIEFRIPESGFVTLIVYDMLGKEVETLINEYKSTGIYKVEFTADNLPSGVYFYQLKTLTADKNAEELTKTKKMLLIK